MITALKYVFAGAIGWRLSAAGMSYETLNYWVIIGLVMAYGICADLAS